MKARINKLWVAALRSDEWEQGNGQLRTYGVERCCLGVLCEVYKEDTGEGEWDDHTFVTRGGNDHYDLPDDVREWAGMEGGESQMVVIDGKKKSLVRHNDGYEVPMQPFTAIADAIEEQL